MPSGSTQVSMSTTIDMHKDETMDAVIVADTTPHATHVHDTKVDTSTDKKRKRVCKSWGVLSAVVDKGGNLSGTEIMKKTGASRSVAFSVVKKAKNYPNSSDELNKMPRVRNQKTVMSTLMSLQDHLIDFPYSDMSKRFCFNAKCDVEESLLPDQHEAAIDRQRRSQRVWRKVMERFDGRDAMNTLLCILYSPMAVSTLVRAAHDDKKEFPGHMMILRLGGIFIVLITDSNTNARFSLDWFLRRGEHTSAFIWLNIKECAWSRHRNIPSAMLSSDARDVVVDTGTHVQNTDKYDTLSKVSEVTMAGIHFLKYLRVQAEILAQTAALTGATCSHLYLMPYTRNTTGKSFKRGGSTPVSDKWCVDTDDFVARFVVRNKIPIIGAEFESGMYIEQPRIAQVHESPVDESNTVVNDENATTDKTEFQVPESGLEGDAFHEAPNSDMHVSGEDMAEDIDEAFELDPEQQDSEDVSDEDLAEDIREEDSESDEDPEQQDSGGGYEKDLHQHSVQDILQDTKQATPEVLKFDVEQAPDEEMDAETLQQEEIRDVVTNIVDRVVEDRASYYEDQDSYEVPEVPSCGGTGTPDNSRQFWSTSESLDVGGVVSNEGSENEDASWLGVICDEKDIDRVTV